MATTLVQDFSEKPARHCTAVTPSDSTELNCRALYVGGTGDVALKAIDDSSATAVVFSAVPAGTILPVSCNKVMSTSTTATLIVALY